MKRFMTTILSLLTLSLFSFDATIPVLHLPDFFQEETKDAFLEKLESAAKEVGFFALTGTGIDSELLDSSYEEIQKFFALDLEEKLTLQAEDGQRGYSPGESAKSETKVDFKEFYHIGREISPGDTPPRYQNVWSEKHPEFKEKMLSLFQAMDECSFVIGEAFSCLFGKEKNFVKKMTEKGSCLLRVIHYPANPPEDAIWAGAHTDIDLFTILPRATAKGLQVLNAQDEWIDVSVPDGAFVINCGDMLENLTNGYFKSSYHRVTDPGEKKERFSAVFFVHPQPMDKLDPLPSFIEKTGGVQKYANAVSLDLLAERLIDLGLASDELITYFLQSGVIEKLKEVGRLSPKAEAALLAKGYQI